MDAGCRLGIGQKYKADTARAIETHCTSDTRVRMTCKGALLRVRPKAMTVAVILAGLLPVLIGSGTGSEVMSRIAAPMVGGMLTAPLLSMLVIPAAYLLMRRRYVHPAPPEGEVK